MKRAYYLLFIMLLLFQSCSKYGIGRYVMRKQKPKIDFSFNNIPVEPDYSKENSWIIKDNINETIDVFYVYPTSYYSPNNWNADINDTNVTKRLKNFTFKKQLDIFKGIGNVYAPLYRQASLYSFIDKNDNGEQAIELAYSDVKRAFYYYFEHFNGHKPFMLVGHSQGSKHLLKLLEEISKDPKIKNKIIATYAIGWPVSEKYLERNPQINMCKSYCQTGCVISWNTEGKHKLVSLIKEPSVSVNPLTWTIDDSIGTKQMHKGAIFVSKNSIDTVFNAVTTQNINGHLIISKPDNVKEIWMPFKYGNYHVHDYNMFYFNIRENAIKRKGCFWKN